MPGLPYPTGSMEPPTWPKPPTRPLASKPDAVPVRLIVHRVKPTPGSQLVLIANYSYHAFVTDREGDTLELEADHRRHAEVENAIRDLKYGVGLNHLPSGQFAVNAALMAVQVPFPQPGPLDFPHRFGCAGGEHKDPQAPPVLPGRRRLARSAASATPFISRSTGPGRTPSAALGRDYAP